jgi:hypothetical protein
VLNPIMQIQLGEVKRILPIRLVQHIGSIAGNKETETRAKVVCRSDLLAHFLKRDVLAVMGQDTCGEEDRVMKPAEALMLKGPTVVCHSIKGRARATAIALLGRYILGPLPTRTWVPFWGDTANLPQGQYLIRKGTSQVPHPDFHC